MFPDYSLDKGQGQTSTTYTRSSYFQGLHGKIIIQFEFIIILLLWLDKSILLCSICECYRLFSTSFLPQRPCSITKHSHSLNIHADLNTFRMHFNLINCTFLGGCLGHMWPHSYTSVIADVSWTVTYICKGLQTQSVHFFKTHRGTL